MHNKQKHIIQKVFLEVETGSLKTAHYLRENMGLFLKKEIFPLLETYFDTVQTSGKTVSLQMENLHLDLDVKEEDLTGNFSALKGILQKQLEKETEKLSVPAGAECDPSNVKPVSPERRQYNTFFHFVKTGETPWWTSADQVSSLSGLSVLETVCRQKGFKRDFRDILQDKVAVKRLLRQFPAAALTLLFKNYCEENYSSKPTITTGKTISPAREKSHHPEHKVFLSLLDFLKKKRNQYTGLLKEKLWDSVVDFALTKDEKNLENGLIHLSAHFTEEEVRKLLPRLKSGISRNEVKELPVQNPLSTSSVLQKKEIGPEKKDRTEIHAIPSRNTEIHALSPLNKEGHLGDSEETFLLQKRKEAFVENAGLILLHPFLKPFFLDCGVITPDNVFINKELAAHLLHYVATEREMDTENFMVFEKFLCGIPLHHPMTREIPLTGKHKEKASELLSSATEQWDAIKNTSIRTIRSEFIQRPGKLVLEKDNPAIIVERKTQDILLEKLPWNISIVKIPWLKKLIFVEW
ncbi:contractile injection system tape measure protein [Sinomicrobium sp. M5D2P9]